MIRSFSGFLDALKLDNLRYETEEFGKRIAIQWSLLSTDSSLSYSLIKVKPAIQVDLFQGKRVAPQPNGDFFFETYTRPGKIHEIVLTPLM